MKEKKYIAVNVENIRLIEYDYVIDTNPKLQVIRHTQWYCKGYI